MAKQKQNKSPYKKCGDYINIPRKKCGDCKRIMDTIHLADGIIGYKCSFCGFEPPLNNLKKKEKY